ncbi:kinase domain protein [Ostertagia ostertagi]
MPRLLTSLGGFIVAIVAVKALVVAAAISEEDGFITEELIDTQQLESVPLTAENAISETTPCCRNPALENANYLYVSTMDGRLHALDAVNGGRVVWVADFDAEALLCGTLGKVQPMKVDGRLFNLIPALDGTLYMYSRDDHLLEPIPLNTDLLLQASIRVGHDAVAGGRTISTTGVDPLTGEVRYHCSSSHCDSVVTEPVTSTLVFRRSTSKVRAVDALSGHERWNLSVSEYDATLVTVNRGELYPRGARIRYLVQPPDGIVTAYDNCGNELWSRQLGSHIAHTWKLEGGELSEVSLFNTENIHTLSITDGQPGSSASTTPSSESLFYLGTVGDEPFIMHSTHVKKEMIRIAKNMDYSEPNPSSASGQLTRSGTTYLIEKGTVDDLLSASYKRSFTAQQAKKNNKQVAIRDSRGLQVVATEEGRSTYAVSCPNNEGTALIGEKDIRSAAFDDPENGNQGWFVLRPSGKTKKRTAFFEGLLDPNQCPANLVERMSRTLRVDNMVSGWWRVVALAMLGLVGSATVILHALVGRRRRRQGALTDSPSSSDVSSMNAMKKTKRAETRSTSAGPSVGTSTLSIAPSPADQVTRQRRTTSSRESGCEPFHSKFLQDFEPVKLLGHGGFGVVFEARNRLDECPYAVKRIAVANNERAIQRVLREVRAMAKLDHPGIIRYYHTWIERPPDGWQVIFFDLDDCLYLKRIAQSYHIKEEEDCLMLKGMQLRFKRKVEEDESMPIESSSSSAIVPHPVSESSLHPSLNDIVAPALNGHSDDGSWLDDVTESKAEMDESSSDSEDQVARGDNNVAAEESESIIFGAEEAGDCNELAAKNSDELSKIGKKMVLVTSTDEDLMPSANTSNFVYIYIQMQLCQEQTLHAWLSKHRSWEDRPLDKMKVWMAQLCSAVSYIHQQGLIHRDIKPQNIFFASDQALKVGDLGLVTRCVPAEDQPIEKNVSQSALHTDNVGTRGYMSPEQLANKPYTFKVDVFSMGLIYCELVIPFQTLMERSLTLSDLQHGRMPDALKGMKEEEVDFIVWLTSMDPEKRPTCDEILDSDYMAGVETRMLMGNRTPGTRRRIKSEAALLDGSA